MTTPPPSKASPQSTPKILCGPCSSSEPEHVSGDLQEVAISLDCGYATYT